MAEHDERKGVRLRKLILKQNSWNFDLNTEFDFKTVYDISAYSYIYKMCSCAFEHELFDYLSESGEVDEEMLDKIIQCINDGQCPHVNDEDDDEFIEKTTVHGIHAAAALGDEHLLNGFNLNPMLIEDELENGVLQLHPYVLAVLKNNPQVLDDIKDATRFEVNNWCSEVLHCIRQRENEKTLNLTWRPMYKIALDKGNTEIMNWLLKHFSIPDSMMTIADAYEAMSKHAVDFTESIAHLLHQIKCLPESDKETYIIIKGKEYISCAEPAIVCNEPRNLDKALRCSAEEDLKDYHKKALHETCCVLERDDCKKILKTHSIPTDSAQLTESDRAERLIHLLQYYPKSRKEIEAALKQILPPIEEQIHACESKVKDIGDMFLEKYILWYMFSNKAIDIEVVKCLFDLGAHVDTVDDINFEGLLLEQLLVNGKENKNARELMDLLIYENPNTESHRIAVEYALKMDNELFNYSRAFGNSAGNYTMDAKKQGRSIYGQKSFAFTFAAPLLIEAGFPFSRTRLERRLDRIPEHHSKARGRGLGGLLDARTLHPTEKLYFEKCLDEPRSLMLQCRDCLRRHFRGRQLHTFTKTFNIPSIHKDFILLKSLLCTV